MAFGLGLASFYLIPAYFWQLDFQKDAVHEFIQPWYLPISMLYPGKVTFFNRHGRTPHEYIFFVGPVVLYFFFASFKLRDRLKSFYPLLLTLLVSFIIGWGSFKALGSPVPSPLDLVMEYIPGFQAAQVPTRFWMALLPSVIILSLFTLQYKMENNYNNWSKSKKVALLLFLLAPLWGFNLYSQLRLFGVKESSRQTYQHKLTPYEKSDEFYQADYTTQMMALMRPNVGIKNCYQGIQIPTAPELKTDGSSFLLSAPKNTTLSRGAWDRITLTFDKPTDNITIKLNQNHHPNWRVTKSSCVANVISKFKEPLTVEISAGCKELKLKHTDMTWYQSIKVSLIFFVLWIIWGLTLVYKRKKT
jgi:hypothetical protein